MSRYDVIVIGVGAMGSSACRELAMRGRRVLGLEQHDIPHDLGSSHGDSRLIRFCYYEHPDYVPLLRRTYELWEERNAAGTPVFIETGGLYMGTEDDELISGSLESARTHDLPHERLDRGQLADRYPQFTVPDDHVAIYEPRGGLLRPEASVSGAVVEALANGAVLHGRERVTGWEAGDGGVEVRTDRDRYTADRLVLAGGAWAPELLAGRVELQVSRQVLAWVWPSRPERFALGVLPIWGVGRGGGTLDYGFPLLPGGRPGFKLALHERGSTADPNALDRSFRDEDRATIERILAEDFGEENAPILSVGVCMYTNTSDGHFLLDAHPAHDNVIVAAGFSGHGFKFAPVVGEIIADLVDDGATRHSIGFLGFQRFTA